MHHKVYEQIPIKLLLPVLQKNRSLFFCNVVMPNQSVPDTLFANVLPLTVTVSGPAAVCAHGFLSATYKNHLMQGIHQTFGTLTYSPLLETCSKPSKSSHLSHAYRIYDEKICLIKLTNDKQSHIYI